MERNRLVSEVLRAKLEAARIGVVAQGLSGINPAVVASNVATAMGRHLHVAAIGYELSKAAGVTVSDKIEDAVAWRNRPELAGTIVVFVREETAKMHSLADFDRLRVRDLTLYLLKLGEERLAINRPQKRFWQALQELADTFPLHLVEDFFRAVEAHRDDTDAIPDNLWRLGLLRDNKILNTQYHPVERLRRNRDLLAEVGRLSESSKQRIANALTRARGDEFENLRRGFQLLRQYHLRGDRRLLQQLEMTIVEELLAAGRPQRSQTPKEPETSMIDNGGGSGHGTKPLQGARLEAAIADGFVVNTSDARNALREFVDFIRERMAAPEDTPTEIAIEPFFGGQYLRPELPSSTVVNFLSALCNERSWGGTVYTKPGAIQELLSQIKPNEIVPFNPEDPADGIGDKSFFDVLRIFDEKLGGTGAFQAAIDRLVQARRVLLDNIGLLISYPLALFGGDAEARRALIQYLDAFATLLHLLRQNAAQLSEFDSAAWKFTGAKLLRLEVIYFSMKDEAEEKPQWKAMLSPLHPLHLWRYKEIVQFLDSRASDLDHAERRLLSEGLVELPHLVHYVLLDPDVTGSANNIVLPQAGTVEGLPTYENHTNRYLGKDAVDFITDLLDRWVREAPYSRAQVRVALVDVPDIPEAVRAIAVYLQESPDCAVTTDMYFTRNRNPLAELRLLDYEEKDYWVTEILRAGRLRLHVHTCESIEQVAEVLKSRPVHIAYLFDQQHYSIEYAPRAQTLLVSPLVVSYDYEYRELVRHGVIAPSSHTQEGIFADYHYIVQRVANLSPSEQIRLEATHGDDTTVMNELLRVGAARWLAIADRVLTSYAPSDGIPLGERRIGQREVGVWARASSRIVDQFLDLLRQYNVHPDREVVIEALRRFGHIAAGGLMSLPSASGDRDHRERQQKGFVGTLLAAMWYTNQYPGSLVASLDTNLARQWLVRHDASRGRADLIGLRMSGEELIVEVIEVKTHASDGEVRIIPGTSAEGAILEGPAIEQLTNTMEVLDPIFRPSDSASLFTPARREVLKYQLHRECFRNIHEAPWQKGWYDRLRAAFAYPEPSIHVRIQGLVIHVKLEEHSGIMSVVDSHQGITYMRLGARAVQELLVPATPGGGHYAPDGSEHLGDTQTALDVEMARESTPLSECASKSSVDFTAEVNVDVTAETSVHVIESSRKVSAKASEDPVTLREAEEIARRFRRACESYRIRLAECDPSRAVLGPNVWRFYIRLQPGQRVEALRSALEDIGRDMSYSGLLVGSIPNSSELTLDIPRSKRELCGLEDGLAHLPRISSPEQMPITIGVTPEGNHIIRDLRTMPHMLVGGTTGAGKTMFLYGVLVSLLTTHPDPQTLRILLSTSKPEDFTFFEGLPHLESGTVVFDAERAIHLLENHVGSILDERSRILIDARCRDIVEYNQKYQDKLPPIVVIVDEFADLADQLSGDRDARNAFYTEIRRIAQMGRSRGVHLVLCTQRPSADLVPTNIRTLMNARVALRVNDAAASRMILEEAGAEHLQLHGDMLFKEHANVMRLQGYFVDTDTLEKIITGLRQNTD